MSSAVDALGAIAERVGQHPWPSDDAHTGLSTDFGAISGWPQYHSMAGFLLQLTYL